VTIFTIGHSTRPIAEFLGLLARSRIARLVDIRAFPGSRRYPHFNRDALAGELPAGGIEYLHRPSLGGRRRLPPDSPPSAWRNDSFRAYAEYMRTPEFRAALDELIELAAAKRTVIMCSEAVPWRCHRTLVSDALIARGIRVEHILDAGVSEHVLTRFAVVQDGEVTYPATSDSEGDVQHALDLRDSRPRTPQ
jgi:uncharacterized protein (DUF488 family)